LAELSVQTGSRRKDRAKGLHPLVEPAFLKIAFLKPLLVVLKWTSLLSPCCLEGGKCGVYWEHSPYFSKLILVEGRKDWKIGAY
jgi:hypothetical protein